MKTKEAQRIVRELSPQYLADNPPVGIVANLAAITERYKPKFVEFRQPFARKPTEEDEPQACYLCGGDETIFSAEDNCEVDCPQCGGSGELPFMDNEVFLTVWRDSHSIETLAVVLPTGEVNAWVSTYEPGYLRGTKIELTELEKEAALDALRAKPETE